MLSSMFVHQVFSGQGNRLDGKTKAASNMSETTTQDAIKRCDNCTNDKR